MSNFKNGTERLFYIFVTNAYFPVGCLTGDTFNESSEMLGTTTRDNGKWKTSIPTNQVYNISLSGLVSKTNIGGTIISHADLKLLKRNGTKFGWRCDNEVTGYSDFGEGHIISMGNAAEIDSFISFSAEIEGYGEPILQLTSVQHLSYVVI